MAIHPALSVLLVVLTLLPGGTLRAQTQDAMRNSAPRLVIEGVEVILHKVEKGESLYAISRKYAVSQADIAKFNPDIYYGLKKGQMLRIPTPKAQNTAADPQTGREYQLHVVLPGETLYQLARRFSVSVPAIKAANMLRGDTLKLYETIRIPMAGETADGENPIIHTAQKGQALYGIARLYDVSVEEILEQNPSVRERGLQAGDQLRIARRAAGAVDSMQAHELLDSVPSVQNPSLCDFAQPFSTQDTLEIALLLPFSVGSRAQSADDEFADGARFENRIAADTRFLEFYQGALLALEHFQLRGRHMRLKVFDTQRSAKRMRQIVASDSLSGASLIIGPVYPENITIASGYAAHRRIAMVSPLSGKTPSFDTNPFLYQANPSLLTQLRQVVHALPYDSVARIILLREEGEAEKDLSESVLFMLQECISERAVSPAMVQTVTFTRSNSALQSRASIQKHLLAGQRNLVLVPSNNEAFVGEILGLLNAIALNPNYPITVYGMPKWMRFPKLDIEELIKLNATLFSPFHVDYTREEVLSFVDTYRATFRGEPTQYGFQGYDILRYFVTAIHTYGEDFRYCLKRLNVRLLQTPLHFVQSKQFGSYESVGLYLLRFTPDNGLTATPAQHP